MSLKLVSYKIEESTDEKIKKICELENIKQSDFINNAIAYALQSYLNESGGGVSIQLPPPCLFQELSEETQSNVIELLNETSYKFSKLVGGRLDVGLDLIKLFCVESFNQTKEQRKKQKTKYTKYQEIIKEV